MKASPPQSMDVLMNVLQIIQTDVEQLVYFQFAFVECTNRNLICRMPHVHKNNVPWLFFQGRQVLLIDPICKGNYRNKSIVRTQRFATIKKLEVIRNQH